jgi:RNA polymerase sigma-70 factor, ECF subfamily
LERSDAELVEAASRGDIAGFRELYERHYRTAVGIARSRLSDVHLAEDAAQEAFATACRRLALLKDGRRFPQWLGTICRRTASRMARSRVNHQPIQGTAASTSQSNNASAAAKRIERALATLSASGREVILLHYFSGLTYEEISRVLRITPQSVHGRMQRARRDLAAELSEDSERDE